MGFVSAILSSACSSPLLPTAVPDDFFDTENREIREDPVDRPEN
jgi:hypothetical protein